MACVNVFMSRVRVCLTFIESRGIYGMERGERDNKKERGRRRYTEKKKGEQLSFLDCPFPHFHFQVSVALESSFVWDPRRLKRQFALAVSNSVRELAFFFLFFFRKDNNLSVHKFCNFHLYFTLFFKKKKKFLRCYLH